MKSYIKGMFTGVFITVFLLSSIGYAATKSQKIDVMLNSIVVKIEGKTLATNNIIYNNSVYVPVDKIAVALGKDYAWDKKTNVVSMSNPTITNTATLKRDNSTAKLTTLGAGSYIVGSDIPPGRYTVTSSNSGNLSITDPSDFSGYTNEIVGGEHGVKSVTIDAKTNQSIKISGTDSMVFTPAVTELLSSLSSGTWVVGIDIKPGKYTVTAPSGSGNINITSKNLSSYVNEILTADTSDKYGVTTINVTLENGNIIRISSLDQVDFKIK